MTFRTSLRLLLVSVGLIGLIAACSSSDSSSTENDTQIALATEARTVSSNKIDWLRFDEGQQIAQTEGKQLLVDFTASWCGWCKKMDAETFSQPEVIQFINENFVPVKVWGDSDDMLKIDTFNISEKQLAQMAGVRGYPTFGVFNSKLESVHRFSGYRDGTGFITEASKAL